MKSFILLGCLSAVSFSLLAQNQPTSPPPRPVTKEMQEIYDRANAKPTTSIITTPTRTEPTRSKPEKTSFATTGDFRGRSYIGIKAGGNYTTVLNENTDAELSFAPGYHAGIVFNAALGNVVSFQPEILYNHNALKSKQFGDTYTFTSSSVDIPLLFRFSFGNQTQFFINAGVMGSYVLKTTSELTGTKIKNDLSDLDFADRTNFSGVAGIGVAHNLPKGQIFLEARGHYLLGNLSEGFYKSDAPRDLHATLSLGYLIPF